MVLSKSKALKYSCENYISKDTKLCGDCKYIGANHTCLNINNCKVEDDKLTLCHTEFNKIACKLFKKYSD